jgi:integrase/recombinase XerD
MLTTYLKDPLTLERYRSEPAGPHLDAFLRWLEQRGYQPRRIHPLLRGVHRFSRWAHSTGLTLLQALDDTALLAFRRHLHDCRRLYYPSGRLSHLFVGARHFVTFLAAVALIAPVAVVSPQPPEPALLEAFRGWMRTHQGTTEATLSGYRQTLLALLHALGEQSESFAATALRDFVLTRAGHGGIGRAKTVVTVVRMFLRFLIAIGRCRPDLDHALPSGGGRLCCSIYPPQRWNVCWPPVIAPRRSGGGTTPCSYCSHA